MKSPKPKRRLQVQPLKGRFFDMKPSKKPNSLRQKPVNSRRTFLWVVFIIFALLMGFRLFSTAKELFEQNKQAAFQGVSQLEEAVKAAQGKNLVGAKEAFGSAELAFGQLNESLSDLMGGGTSFPQNRSTLNSIQALAQWTLQVSSLGRNLSAWAELYAQNLPSFESAFSGDASRILNQIHQAKSDFDPLFAQAQELDKTLKNLNLPFLKVQLSQAKGQFSVLMAYLNKLNAALEGISLLLGDGQAHKYLILFQNSNERRATGGFIGSAASVTVKNGVMGEIEPYDIYNIDRHLKEHIPAPPGIDQISEGRLYSRDANYWPDFPKSAEMILSLMEKSGFSGFDTVVAIDQTVAETVLAYIPPLYTEDGVFEINAETFSPLLQFYTEAKLSQSINPKAFLFTLIPKIKADLAKVEDKETLTQAMLDLTKKGHLQLYSTHPQAQLIFDELNLSGRLLPAKEGQDFLSVINTSIGGNKSDRYMNMALEHKTQVGQKGDLKDELTIKKRHTWSDLSWDAFAAYADYYGTGKLNLDDLRFILGEGGNVDYLRIYVPKGAALLDAQGVDFDAVKVSEDMGYTVFAFTFGPVAPGQVQEVKLVYDLPFSLTGPKASYAFVAQPQAATENVFLNKTFQLNSTWKALGGRLGSEPVLGKVPILEGLFQADEWYWIDLVSS